MSDTVEITGEERVLRNIARIERIGVAPKTYLDPIGAIVAQDNRSGFDRSQAPDGSPWAALKKRVGKPLLNTGVHLRNPLHSEMDGEDAVLVGVPVAWGAVHQYGSRSFGPNKPGLGRGHAARNIPARPFLGVSANARGQIYALLKDITSGAVFTDTES